MLANWQQQELENPDGPLPRSIHLPRGAAGVGKEPGQVQVGSRVDLRGATSADCNRFMFDKIMPLSEAVEGYDLFDQMKVQKVVFTP
jgi:hypothetical protein